MHVRLGCFQENVLAVIIIELAPEIQESTVKEMNGRCFLL